MAEVLHKKLEYALKTEERALDNYRSLLSFLTDAKEIETVLGLIRDEKKHIRMVGAIIKYFAG